MKKISFLILICFTAISLPTKAQIIFTDVNPDIVVDTWDVRQLDIDKDGSADINLWFHPWGTDANVQAVSTKDVELLGNVDSSEFYPFALELDSTIDSAGAEWQTIKNKYVNLSHAGNKGNWIGKAEKYLAFRMKKSNQWFYGWIMITVEGASLPTAFVIHEYAYQSEANKGIKAGEKEETTGIKSYPKTINKPGLIFNNQASSLIIQDSGTSGKLTIYDVQGRSRLVIQNRQNYERSIDLSSLEKGFYIAVLQSGNTIQTLKIDKL